MTQTMIIDFMIIVLVNVLNFNDLKINKIKS